MKTKTNRLAPAIFGLLLLTATSNVAALADDKEPLQGGVDETAPLEPSKQSPDLRPSVPMAAPVVPKKLTGGVKEDAKKPLDGSAQDENEDLNPMTPMSDEDKKILRANAAKNGGGGGLQQEDPDADDQELMVAWDKWRNRFLYSIQNGMQEELNNPEDADLRWDPQRQVMLAKFPMGTTAWFRCVIDAQRHVTEFKLMRSSGYPNYDKAVERSVKNLNGTSILKFPNRSHRTMVTQVAGIKTSDTSSVPNIHFNDVERYRSGQ